MSAPVYIAHQGQVPIEIDHAFCVFVLNFERTKATPTTVKKTAGAVTKTVGIPDVTGSFDVIIPTTGFGGILDLTDFTISYPWAGSKYLIQHCSWNHDSRTVTPASGESTQKLSFTGTTEISI